MGIDEVGRGCWAGPLVAGAVILSAPIHGLKDSKKLSKIQRERLAAQIEHQAVAYVLGWVWPAEIDRDGLSISVARAMQLALDAIDETDAGGAGADYDEIIIDGSINYLPKNPKSRALIKADDLVPAASAASILAKVARDNYMATFAATEYPAYGFEQHVGYGTVQHMQALQEHGVTAIHRVSYKPIQKFVLESNP